MKHKPQETPPLLQIMFYPAEWVVSCYQDGQVVRGAERYPLLEAARIAGEMNERGVVAWVTLVPNEKGENYELG